MIALLSGGMDSSTLLAYALKENCKVKLALALDYGQLHYRELECAVWQAEHYGIPFKRIDISSVFEDIENPLLGTGGVFDDRSYAEQAKDREGKPVTSYVPNRNMVLLSIAAAHAISVDATHVAYGAHMDDAAHSAYPDCSLLFVSKMNDVLQTQGIKLWAPWVEMNYSKSDVVRVGLSCGVDFSHTWSCYKGGNEPCGVCGTCRDRTMALKDNWLEEREVVTENGIREIRVIPIKETV